MTGESSVDVHWLVDVTDEMPRSGRRNNIAGKQPCICYESELSTSDYQIFFFNGSVLIYL